MERLMDRLELARVVDELPNTRVTPPITLVAPDITAVDPPSMTTEPPTFPGTDRTCAEVPLASIIGLPLSAVADGTRASDVGEY
jgi:hypothetical protein